MMTLATLAPAAENLGLRLHHSRAYLLPHTAEQSAQSCRHTQRCIRLFLFNYERNPFSRIYYARVMIVGFFSDIVAPLFESAPVI